MSDTEILTIGHSNHSLSEFLGILRQHQISSLVDIQGVTKLLEIAGRHRTAAMCAEGDYRRCHRQLVSDYLVANKVAVQHIVPDGEVKPHVLTPRY